MSQRRLLFPSIIARVMLVARRSMGVVVIVALLGWTVNQPMWCQGQHSRAAVVVPAGASPAYKPEPSPSRHTCCPRRESSAVTPEAPASGTCPHHHTKPSPECCSMSGKDRPGLPAGILAKPQIVTVALVPSLEALRVCSQHLELEPFSFGPPSRASSTFTVLRL